MKPTTRTYRLRRRAETQAKTRARIVAAAVKLHGSRGPLATTISAIAERAGVERETVYRHFPDERSLFAACTAHYLAMHPGPAIDAWRQIADPRRRLERALREVYANYSDTEDMTAAILRDAEAAPERVGASFAAFDAAARAALLHGWDLARGKRHTVRSAIGHALRFQTWRSLVRDEGLGGDIAAELMTSFVIQVSSRGGSHRPSRPAR